MHRDALDGAGVGVDTARQVHGDDVVGPDLLRQSGRRRAQRTPTADADHAVDDEVGGPELTCAAPGPAQRDEGVRTRVAEQDGGEDVGRLTFADLELDEDSHEVRRAGRTVDLSPTEFKLLRYLMLNPNRVLSKSQILDHVWDYDFRGESGIVESYISYLRRKIDTEAPVALIHTRRGVGYVLRLPPEQG